MRGLCAFLLFILVAPSLANSQQKTPPVQRKDSVSVSAGIPKEQLALEDRLSTVVSEADQFLKAGEVGDAVKRYEAALEMVHKEPLLAGQEERILRKLGNVYVRANRSSDAIQIFQKLLGLLKRECESDSTVVATCANAQQDLAVSQMRSGDLESGLSSLRQAEANYAKAEKLSDSHEFTMIQAKDRAQARMLIAVALFQLGRTTEAVKAAGEAIPELNRVKQDSSINIGIREDAANSVRDAQTILERFKAAQ
jgi:tetratricopeptide (TPR) repeat protein